MALPFSQYPAYPACDVRYRCARRCSPDVSDTSTDSDNCCKRRVCQRREQRRREHTHVSNKQLLPAFASTHRPTSATPQYRLRIGRLSSHQITVSSDDDAYDSVGVMRSQDEEEEAKLGLDRTHFRPNEATASGDAMQRVDLRRGQDFSHNNSVQMSSLKYALKRACIFRGSSSDVINVLAYVETEREANRKMRYERQTSSEFSEYDDEEESYDELRQPGYRTRRVRRPSDSDCPSPSLTLDDDEESYDERRNQSPFDRCGRPIQPHRGAGGVQARPSHGHRNNNAVDNRRTSRSFKGDEDRYDERPKSVSFDRGRKRTKTRPPPQVTDGQTRRRHRNTDTFRPSGYNRMTASLAAKADVERADPLSRDRDVHVSYMRPQPEPVDGHSRRGHRNDRTSRGSVVLLEPPTAPNSDNNTDPAATRNVRSVLGYTNHTVTYDCPSKPSDDAASTTRHRRNSSPERQPPLLEYSGEYSSDKRRRGRPTDRQRTVGRAEPDGVHDPAWRRSVHGQCEYQNNGETISGNSLQKHVSSTNSKRLHQSAKDFDASSSNDRHRGDNRRCASQHAAANTCQTYYIRNECGDEETAGDPRSRRHKHHTPSPASVRSLSPDPRRRHRRRPADFSIANRNPADDGISDDENVHVRSPRHAVANYGTADSNSRRRSEMLVRVDPWKRRHRHVSPAVPSVRSLSPLSRRQCSLRPHRHRHRRGSPAAGRGRNRRSPSRSHRQPRRRPTNTAEDNYRSCRTSVIHSASDTGDNATTSTFPTDDEGSVGFPERQTHNVRQVSPRRSVHRLSSDDDEDEDEDDTLTQRTASVKGSNAAVPFGRPLGVVSSDSDVRRRPKAISVEASDTMSDGGVSSHQQLIVDLVIEPSHENDDDCRWTLGTGSRPSSGDEAGPSKSYVTARPPTAARRYTGHTVADKHATHRVTSGRRSPDESFAGSPMHSPRTLELSKDETTLSGSQSSAQSSPRRIRIIRDLAGLEASLTDAELDDDCRHCEPRKTESTPATLLLEKLMRNAQAISDSSAAAKGVKPSAQNEAALLVQQAVTKSKPQMSQPQQTITGSQARHAVTRSEDRHAVTGSEARHGAMGSHAQHAVKVYHARQAVTGSHTRHASSEAQHAVTRSEARHGATESKEQNSPFSVTSSTAQEAIASSLAQDAVARSPLQQAIMKRLAPPGISRPGIMKVAGRNKAAPSPRKSTTFDVNKTQTMSTMSSVMSPSRSSSPGGLGRPIDDDVLSQCSSLWKSMTPSVDSVEPRSRPPDTDGSTVLQSVGADDTTRARETPPPSVELKTDTPAASSRPSTSVTTTEVSDKFRFSHVTSGKNPALNGTSQDASVRDPKQVYRVSYRIPTRQAKRVAELGCFPQSAISVHFTPGKNVQRVETLK